MRALWMVVIVAGALIGAIAAAGASDRHPWCLVVQDWGDGWACGYDTFAQCQAEARAGNTGFCAANPYFQAPAAAKPSPPKRKTR